MARLGQDTFKIDTTVGFQRVIDFQEPLRTASIINISSVTLSIALGSNDVKFFSLPATTAIDIQPWDLHYVVVMKATFTVAITAPAGTSFSMVWIESKESLMSAIAAGAVA